MTNEFCISILVYLVTIVLCSFNFNSTWTNKTFDKIKEKKSTWYWFRVFNIKETNENYIKFVKGLSVFVITIITLALIWTVNVGLIRT